MGASTRELSRKLSTSAGGTASNAVEGFIAHSPVIAAPVNTRNVLMSALPGFMVRLPLSVPRCRIRPLQERERSGACGLQKFSAGRVVSQFDRANSHFAISIRVASSAKRRIAPWDRAGVFGVPLDLIGTPQNHTPRKPGGPRQ